MINKSYNLIGESKNNSKNRNLLADIAFEYYNLESPEKFYNSAQVLLKKSVKSNDSVNIGKAYRCKAIYYKNSQVLDSSFYYFLKAEKIYSNEEDKLILGNVLYNKGIVQYLFGDFLGAELSLNRAYVIFKDSEEKEKLYGTVNQLGLVYNELKEYDKAIFFHNKALETVREFITDNKGLKEAVCYNNLGYLSIKQNKYIDAIKNFQLGLKEEKVLENDPELYALLIDNLAYSRLQISNRKDLPKLYFEALRIRERLNDPSLIVLSFVHISEYYHISNQNKISVEYAAKALDKAKESKIPFDMITALKHASLVDKKNSSKYTENYIRISDSLQLEERKNKDRFARIELETDELRQQNTQLSEQNRDILNYFAIAIVFGGFLFFARFQRLKARELALKQTQQQANEEIYRLIISHQNQLEEGRDLEKKRISKELHDGVLGRLFGLRLNLDGLNNFDDEETKQQRLEYLNELKLIEQDLREISHELSRENLVLINNFVAIINNLLEQQSKINKAKINTLISDKIDWEKVSNTIKINLYRILQEALQNINKHAEANKINVIFNKDPKGNLIFSVEDNGKGYNTNGKKTKGIGMDNIVDRVHQCQGKIDIKSQIGKGTKIIITFPLENETINM